MKTQEAVVRIIEAFKPDRNPVSALAALLLIVVALVLMAALASKGGLGLLSVAQTYLSK